MDVVLIGAGNVSTVLGRSLVQAGHHIKAIWNRDPEKAKILASELGTVSVNNLIALPTYADIFLLAVSDASIAEVAGQLTIHQGVLVHTAGAVSKHVLAATSDHFGVLWPMKMIRTSMQTLGPCVVIIDGNAEANLQIIRKLADSISDQVSYANDEKRLEMHMLAAITSNFTNHLYHLAAAYCTKKGIDFSLFYPLIEGGIAQIRKQHPQQVQAGPAFRGDLVTIEKHRHLLKSDADLLKIYDHMTQSILHKFGHKTGDYQ